MILLAVHSTSPQLSVAVVSDGVVMAESILPPGREHLENLAVMIRDLVGHLRISVKSFDGFGVALGPGSFSGIRVGLATIKGMALALQKPVAGILSLEVLAWQALEEGESGAALIDARREEIYVGLYKKSDDRLILLDGPKLIAATDLGAFLEHLPKPPVLVGDSAVEPVMLSASVRSRTVIPSAAACATLAWKHLSQGNLQELHSIAPVYIRRSDAEEKRTGV
ncbi:MAG TPA: tRNA (adenosine(37)-N6)-threonylcarbamoyltransferase complex dimerization subunit type 1 TsaB [Desulfomonilaceae bacterium]|nr:tRNA (adenosine(37)-N6)-threonylcarbamoyltransferase complex dimerization subunit type 1 TsaB [Desulfomonilaceae bacterium]